MADFMLLLYDKEGDFTDMSPEEMQGIVQEYVAWGDRLEAEGKLVGSEKLEDGTGRVLRREGDETRVLDGPFSEAKEIVGGFFTVRAETWEEAVEIAQGCPHVGYGGTVEIRRVEAVE